jgi:hypothetical protein
MGQERVGCWPCIFSRKSELRAIADLDPGRIDLIEELEAQVYEAYLARRKKDGKPVKWQPADLAFYRNPNRSKSAPNGIPIRRAVDWSRTVRGGKQLDMFQPDYAREGCMRWGMCDTGGA